MGWQGFCVILFNGCHGNTKKKNLKKMGEVGILVGEHGDTHFEMVQEESDQ